MKEKQEIKFDEIDGCRKVMVSEVCCDDGRHTRAVSWPVSRQQKKRKSKNRWSLFPGDKFGLYQLALPHKFESVENFLKVKAMEGCWCLHTREPVRLFSSGLLSHVTALWYNQKGRCMFTGRPMVWKKEDIQRNPRVAVNVICLGNQGFEWREGNIGLMCYDAMLFLWKTGFDYSLRIARQIYRFHRFKQNRKHLSKSKIFEEWDSLCCFEEGTPRWTGLNRSQTKILCDEFLGRKLCDTNTQISWNTRMETAWYCVDLYCEQRGRCALSGVLFSKEKETQLTVDRIDCAISHRIGNLMLTTRHVNIGRGNMTVDNFLSIVCDAVEFNK
jgi:hypothetical protein